MIKDSTELSTPSYPNATFRPHSHSHTPPAPIRILNNTISKENFHLKEPPPLAPLHDQVHGDVPLIQMGIQNCSRPLNSKLKEHEHGLNGLKDHSRVQTWDSLKAEKFVQHFHQAVLNSTHKSQLNAKGKRVSCTIS